MQKAFLFIVFIAVLFTCCTRQVPFDKIKWKTTDDVESYPYRDAMLTDLTKNYKLKGLSKNETHQLLGDPDTHDSLSECYTILVHYDVIDPDYVKNLILYLNKDSTIKDFSIEEWKKH